jgi:3-isopropylmalate/(R)-2-methylmalate dehydratase small subunit
MASFTTLTSRIVPLPINDVDTDQIIPARFMKGTDKDGLAENLFADWRRLPDGTPNPGFVLNKDEFQGAQILLAGDNFGCGSSREHAPWALMGWGIRAVISSSFADIFKNNALKNGLLPIIVPSEKLQELFEFVEEVPNTEFHIDLRNQSLDLPDGSSLNFPVDSFSKHSLIEGVDQLDYLLSLEDQIKAYEVNHDLP